MKRRILIVAVLVLAVLAMPFSVAAQDYYFSLDKMTVDVYWRADGTASLDYYLTFTNQPSGHPIEYIDVGVPNSNFDFDSIYAEINGRQLNISRDFQGSGSSGFAVEMGNSAIKPGQTATVRVYVARVNDVLYNDDNDEAYASAVFAPLYFLSSVITGSTDVTVTYHLPPGVQPSEPRWHSAPSGFPSEPQTGFDGDGNITYTWRNPNADGSRQYTFGASFPKKYIPADSIVTVPLISFDADALFSMMCFFFFMFLFIGIPTIGAISANRRRLQYMPPKISIEGHGIKRGLTAVESAILMQQPLDKVMTMILFGVIKKNAAEVNSRNPLNLKVASPLPERLHDYEQRFLKAFNETDKRTRRTLLQDMTVALVKSVTEKMKGFSRRETVDYYKNIMEKAWAQVESAGTPEVQSKMFEEALEWTMLDKEYDDRTRRTFTRPIYVPTWWGRYDPSWRGGGSSSTPMSAPTSQSGGLPGADFAASMVSGVETFAGNVIGNVQDFTGRVTNTTNPPPPPPKSSGRSGGGGRSCACACAGCACACAGGGR